tara:strand:+ start:294 stop:1250 length:957 start_codon:yes stop_codon:yes gene_type:complete
MRIVVSGGISPVLTYPHTGFKNCFENYGNMFAKVGHDAMYIGLPSVYQNLETIIGCDLWISEFNTFYIPLYLSILESNRNCKVFLVQHGSYDELNSLSYWGLRAINESDGYIANTVYTKQILSNILKVPIYSDITQPIDDSFFTAFRSTSKEQRILIAHMGGVPGNNPGAMEEDSRRQQLFSAGIFKDYPLTIISGCEEFTRKFYFCEDVVFTEPVSDGEDYYRFVSSHKFLVSLSSMPTLGRDMIIAACSGTVSIASPYFYQQELFPSTTASTFREFHNLKRLIDTDCSAISKQALLNSRNFSYEEVYKRFETKLGW